MAIARSLAIASKVTATMGMCLRAGSSTTPAPRHSRPSQATGCRAGSDRAWSGRRARCSGSAPPAVLRRPLGAWRSRLDRCSARCGSPRNAADAGHGVRSGGVPAMGRCRAPPQGPWQGGTGFMPARTARSRSSGSGHASPNRGVAADTGFYARIAAVADCRRSLPGGRRGRGAPGRARQCRVVAAVARAAGRRCSCVGEA